MKKVLVLTAIVALVTGANVEAIILNPGDILVGDDGAFGGGGGIIRVNRLDGTQTHVASAGFFVDPMFLAFGPAGEHSDSRILRKETTHEAP